MLKDEDLVSLAKKHGTPVYVIDETELDRNEAEIDAAFSTLPIPVILAYPYKANSLAQVIRHMHNHQRWAEVASSLELNLALKEGVDAKSIILNAPYKPDSLLEVAISVGCRLHIDNLGELNSLISLIRQIDFPGRVEIGMRISTPTDSLWSKFGFQGGEWHGIPSDSLWSRFGFQEGEWQEALNVIKSNPKLSLIGLHTHRSNIPHSRGNN
jgi:diaminopimelate decarboxylase